MVADAVKAGFDPDVAAVDPYAALSWIETELSESFERLSPADQAEWVAGYGDPRDEPPIWPEREDGGR